MALHRITNNITDTTYNPVELQSTQTPEVHPDSLAILSLEERQLAQHVQIALRHALCAVAFPLTLLNIRVFLHPRMRTATSPYLVGLSLAQVFSIVSVTMLGVLSETIPNHLTDFWYWIYSIYVVGYAYAVARMGSYPVMCLMSAERLYAVVRPLHVKTFLLSSRSTTVTIAVYIFAAVTRSYTIVGTTIGSTQANNETGIGHHRYYYPQPTSVRLQHYTFFALFALVSRIQLVVVPLLVLMALNTATVWALRRHELRTARMRAGDEKEALRLRRWQERQLTLAVLAGTLAYVTLSLLSTVHFLCSKLVEGYSYTGRWSNLYQVNTTLTSNLIFLSCVVDFVCFASVSSGYRKTLRAIFCPREAKRTRSSNLAQIAVENWSA